MAFVDCNVDKSEIASSAPTLESLSDYQQRKLSDRCTYPGCTADLVDRQCAEHGDAERVRKRLWMRAKRRVWAKAGRCTRCGRARRKGHPWGCSVCIRTLKRFVDAYVDKRARVAAVTAMDDTNRVRYHGKGTRGRMSREQLDAQDMDEAILLATRAKAEVDYAMGPEVADLPRIQRENEMAKAMATAGRAVRHLAEVLRRHGVDVADLVAAAGQDGD